MLLLALYEAYLSFCELYEIMQMKRANCLGDSDLDIYSFLKESKFLVSCPIVTSIYSTSAAMEICTIFESDEISEQRVSERENKALANCLQFRPKLRCLY